MARTFGYSGKTQTIAATTAQTVTFNSSDFNPNGAVAFHFALTGTNTLAQVTRIRVKANGETVVDIATAHFRAFLDRFTLSQAAPATTRAAFTLPLNVPDSADAEKADLCGWPTGAECQIELTTDATTGAGLAMLGWTRSTVAPLYYSSLIGRPLNIAASQTNAQYNVSQRGMIQGLSLNTVGLDRAKLVLSDQEVMLLPGAQYLGAATGDLFREASTIYSGTFSATGVANPAWIKMDGGLEARQGSSYLELSTGAAWAGVTNEATLWSLIGQRR